MKLPTFDYLLLKLAARCNLNCTYCYWFRDKSVYERAKTLTPEAEHALLQKLEEHIQNHSLQSFNILFHGGEPLLFGKHRFVKLLDSLREVERITSCPIHLSITTNGVLLDEDWVSIFGAFNIHPTLSIDGPELIHNSRRVDHVGRGSYQKVLHGLNLLRAYGIEPGVLAVCNPSSDPEIIAHHFINDLDLKHFDILVPDATHEEKPLPIAPYYKRLFDLWYDNYSRQGISIRYLEAMLKGLLGGNAHLESIGYGPIQTCAMLTDGSLEPLDVLRIAGYRSTSTNLSIFTHTFQDLTNDPVWREAFETAYKLCNVCQNCEYRLACGGGFLPHRWSKERRYDNPSVYCEDLKQIFNHIWRRISTDIDVVSSSSSLSLHDAIQQLDEGFNV